MNTQPVGYKVKAFGARKLAFLFLVILLLLPACAPKNEIQSNAGQALVEQGEAYMTCMVEFTNRKQGQVKLEFEKDGETWKMRSSSME